MLSPKFKIFLQHITPQHTLSFLFGVWAHLKKPLWFKNWMIQHFINKYHVDMSEAIKSKPADYIDFHQFFTRHLKPELRPIAHGEKSIISPVDGCISQIGSINDGKIIQAKGFDFTVEELFGGDTKLADQFFAGTFSTLYLAPKDYHRVHMPFAGKLKKMIYIPGHLFSVNQVTTQSVSNLFARNERVVCIFETAFGVMAIVFVGALIVGSISTVWEKNITSKHHKITSIDYDNHDNAEKIILERGDELGYFTLGSTVILLFAPNMSVWHDEFKADSCVKMGIEIGTMIF